MMDDSVTCGDGLYISAVELNCGTYNFRIYRSGQVLVEERLLPSKDEVVKRVESWLVWLGYDPAAVRIPYKKGQSEWWHEYPRWNEEKQC